MPSNALGLLLIIVCAHAGAGDCKELPLQLGDFPIGSSPKNLEMLSSSDCADSEPYLSDCSGVGANGVRYAFFDGALARVSVNGNEVEGFVKLPAGMVFGENIDMSAAKLESMGIALEKSRSGGITIYASGLTLESDAGVVYGIELYSDEHESLTGIVQRTDF